ncbi:MAG TPA: 3-isopropylmalate dehydratase small subunit [Myxococcota bacterium]|nr:3-isopropylmalate dehydratase small subunit [Myxococcota bacterium]
MSTKLDAERVTKRRGRGVVVRGNDIDTDQIIPARYMTSIRFAGLEEFVFRDSRFTSDGVPKGHPFDDKRFRGAEVLVVNQNFGCGSSREHAPQALARWGIRAIVGESFAEIFFGNCIALGIPAVTAARADVAKLMDAVELDPSQEIVIDLAARNVTWRGGSAPVRMPDGARGQLMDGSWDAMRTLLEAREQVLAKAWSLPYVKGF